MNLEFKRKLPTPQTVKDMYPVTEELARQKRENDRQIKAVITGEDQRLMLLIGPCSADREDAVLEYAARLRTLQERVKDTILIVPRIYSNKPRTTGDGYKGMLHQPDPNGQPDMLKGLIAIRKMHMKVLEQTGFSSADELLYPENYYYLSDILRGHRRPVGGGSAAPADRQRPGRARGYEESHQRRPVGDDELHPGRPAPPHVPVLPVGGTQQGQPAGARHPPRLGEQIRALPAQLSLRGSQPAL